ncbi:MAG: type II secretion system F family protein [Raoultibacter sp.]
MDALVVVACVCAAVFATSIYWCWQKSAEERSRRKRLHDAVRAEGVFVRSAPLESRGISAHIIGFMQAETEKLKLGIVLFPLRRPVRKTLSKRGAQMIRVSGLDGSVSVEGMCAARLKLACAGFAAGGVSGLILSNELGFLLGLSGAIAGFVSCTRSLKREGMLRTAGLERHLSEMIEVVSLGLRSGLSFDKAFELYYTHFETGLGADAAKAQQRWVMGLTTREDALRDLASRYNSPIFSRVIENIIRSLRFGSSLAESLEATAVEARAVHKARMEEAVAKAPIKMMIPTGTLILPAMLLLVLGPVLLDMMQGF